MYRHLRVWNFSFVERYERHCSLSYGEQRIVHTGHKKGGDRYMIRIWESISEFPLMISNPNAFLSTFNSEFIAIFETLDIPRIYADQNLNLV